MGVMEDRASATAGMTPPASGLAAADTARADGDWSTALSLYDALLSVDPDHVGALAGRGMVLRAQGHPREALVALLEALTRDPSHRDAQAELALALRDTGRHGEARTLYTLLLKQAGASARAWHGLAQLILSEGHEAAAETCLRRAIALDGALVDARLELAELLARRGDPAQAAEGFHDALAIRPGTAAAHAGLGQALVALGRLDEAADQLERALALDPDNAAVHVARARLRLLSGEPAAAWDDLDWRWSLPGRHRPEAPGIPWDGGGELAGRTILIWAEQGLGETLHGLRHVPALIQRGARVVLGLPQTLAPLAAAGLAGIEGVVASGQPVPMGVEIELNASLADLPRLLGALPPEAAAAPYLTIPEHRRAPLHAPAPAVLKVGVAWAGSRAEWTVPLPQLMPLLALPGVAAYSLQTGIRARDAAELAHPALIADLPSSLSNFADLAARIAEMDVVVAADSATAHLAGAIGVPVCVLVPLAPDWRWGLEGEDSPDYPAARLFRQRRTDNWNRPIQQICAELRRRVAERRVEREASAQALAGLRPACRAFLAAHLQAGDLLLDAGAGDGSVALDAAAHPDGDIRVLTVEARATDAAILADTIAIAGAEDAVEVIAAPLAAQAGPAVVSRQPRGGRAVFPLPGWVRGEVSATTLDALLAERPDLAGRRLVLNLAARGAEDEVLAGLSAQPAVVTFEHRAGSGVAARLAQVGYTLLRFPGPVAAGTVVPFAGESGPVLALTAGLAPADLYGDVSDPASPAAIARAVAQGRALAAEGSAALRAGDLNRAGELYGRALAADPDNAEALANLGNLLRRIGRADAAAACWSRALANGAGAGVRGDLANVLRELGHGLAAEEEFARALTDEPANPHLLYGLGLLERERGRAREAVALFERAEHLRPGAVPRHQLAAALLKAGNLARGMAELAHRPPARLAPVDAPAWDGQRLDARTILVRDENDVIDTLMLARFIPQVARHGGLVVVECVPEAARLLAALPGVEQVVPRGKPLPAVDAVTHLPDVPRLIGTTSRAAPPRNVPYLHLPDGVAPHELAAPGQLRVGLAWSGRPTDRTPPLRALLPLAADPRLRLFSLQQGPRAADLEACGALPFIEDVGKDCTDLADTAAWIASLDLVIAADTAEAHLAGAMGKPVWVLLPTTADWRWVDGREDSVWYPTMRVFRQSPDGSWDTALSRLRAAAGAMAAGKLER